MSNKKSSTRHGWVQEFPAAVFVCDTKGTLLEMNKRAAKSCNENGGGKLIGTYVLDCHPVPARIKIKEMLVTQKANIYTIEKAGVKELIYQAPWYKGGKFAGIVELSLEIPFDIPHFIREG